MKSKSKFQIAKGILWRVVNGDRKGYTDFPTALDEISESRCCGVDCCESVLILRDQTTGNITKIAVDNGEIVILSITTPAGVVVPQS